MMSTTKNRKKRRGKSAGRYFGGRFLLFAITGVFLVMAVYIRAINRKMRELEDLVSRIEVLQYGAEAEPVMKIEAADGAPGASEDVRASYVEKPVERTESEVLQRLGELAEAGDVIAKIYAESARYPQKMLEALANNPEMADFVYGYLHEEARTAEGGLTDGERRQQFPLMLQWDPRWGYEPYGQDNVLGMAGCGPTCMAMVLYSLTGNEELLPDRIAAYSMENGYYANDTGTAWALMEDLPEMYGITVSRPRLSERALQRELDQGHMIVCSMGRGDFTLSGHFIVIYGYGADGFSVNDPNCMARSGRTWTYDEIEGQIKSIWAYGK